MSRVWDTHVSPLSFGLFVIADGGGAHIDGRDASCGAIQAIIDFLLPMIVGSDPIQPEAYSVLLAEAVQLANKAVRNYNIDHHSRGYDENVLAYATVTAAMIVGQ
jgi:hypothetical protein